MLPVAGVVVFVALSGCAGMAATPGKSAVGPATAPATPATTTSVPSPQAIANAQKLAGAPGSTPPPAASSAQSNLRSFADVSRDATEQTGLFNLWQRDDRVYIEIAPSQFDQPFFFSRRQRLT